MISLEYSNSCDTTSKYTHQNSWNQRKTLVEEDDDLDEARAADLGDETLRRLHKSKNLYECEAKSTPTLDKWKVV